LARRPDQRVELQYAPARLAVPHREPGPPAGIQHGRDAAYGERRRLFNCGHSAIGGCPRRSYWRTIVGARRTRRRSRLCGPEAAFWTRLRLLDRWTRGAHPLCDTWV